jgi:hypothetical protein
MKKITKTTSAYVLERRENPELRDAGDLERMAQAEAKRRRKAQRRTPKDKL